MADSGAPPRGTHRSEFSQLVAQIDWIEGRLDAASQGSSAEQLVALGAAQDELKVVEPRAEVFGVRARETNEDKKMYGPKMVGRVLEFCARVEAAQERAEALSAALAPVKEQLEAQARDAERQQELEQQRLAEEQRQEAVRQAEARLRAEEEARQQEEEARRRQEEVARERESERRGQAPPPLGAIVTGEGGGAEGGAVQFVAEQGLTLDEALASLQRNCAEAELADALQALLLLCANVAAHPEEPKFRTIRLLNPHFQRTVARHRGGLEVLLALGFCERRSVEDDELCLVLEEPSLEEDLEGWAAWFDELKQSRDQLAAFMAVLGVRPLPTATLGSGWDAPAPTAAPSDGATLHGQHTGGR